MARLQVTGYTKIKAGRKLQKCPLDKDGVFYKLRGHEVLIYSGTM